MLRTAPLVFAMLLAAPARAAVPGDVAHDAATRTPVARDAFDAVRTEIALRWSVPAERVHVTADSALVSAARDGAELRLEREATDGRFLVSAGTVMGWLRAGVLTRTPVAARPLARGETIDSAAVRITTEVRWGRPVSGDVNVVGWTAARAIETGSPLLAPAVRPATAVRAGDVIKLQLRRGPVLLELNGRAAGTGAAGDTIAIRTDNGTRLNGVITGEGTVLLVGSEREK